jgi:predicted Zn-dependent protease
VSSLLKKGSVGVVVLVLLAAAGWFGRRVYKKATERHLVAKASWYLGKHDARNAMFCLQRALVVNPASVRAGEKMADVLEAAGVPAALSWRIRTAQLEPKVAEHRFAWAETALKMHDSRSAADALSGVDEESKAGAVYQKLMGALAWSAGRNAEAEQHYNEAFRLEPGNRVIMLNLATIHLSSTNEAIARAARLSLEKMATNAELRLPILHELVKEAVLRKSLPRAVAFSEQITRDPGATFGDRVGHLALLRQAGDAQFTSYLQGLKRDATNGPCAFALGRWMVLSEGPTNALRWLQGLPPAVQTNQPVPLLIADCQIALRDWQGLLAMLSRQDWGEADYYRFALESLAQRSLGQRPAATSAWQKARRLSKQRLDRLARLAQLTAGWQWAEETTQVLQEITEYFPREKWAADQLMARFYANGDTAKIADLLGKLYTAHPADAAIKNNLANVLLLRKSDLEKACRLTKEAYQTATNNPFFASIYAYSLVLQKKPQEALEVLSNVNTNSIQLPSIAAYYGVVQAYSGHKEAAKEPLARAAAARLLPEEKEMIQQAQSNL